MRNRDYPEYSIWCNMRQRCLNPHSSHYDLYGGRGIAVCDRWGSFSAFLADMGPRPAGHSIDRIDNEGDYEPNNCRWATAHQQAANKRNNLHLTFSGETHHLREWARRTGLNVVTIFSRLKMGWTAERALGEPTKGRGGSSRRLSDEQVKEMRRRASNGENGKELAKSFGVGHSTACRAISGRTHRAIELSLQDA